MDSLIMSLDVLINFAVGMQKTIYKSVLFWGYVAICNFNLIDTLSMNNLW